MNIQSNVSLRDHSTMRLGGAATYLMDITDARQIAEAVTWAERHNFPVIMIGHGSNIVWRDEGFPGLVLVNKIMGFNQQSAGGAYFLTIGAGEEWDSIVDKSVEAGLTGIECLSLIPGTTGATPVQNVGAYGQEISQSLMTVQAYDRQAGKLINLRASDCDFGYRTSRFKTNDRGRFFITSITLRLTADKPHPPFYAALQDYLDKQHIRDYTPNNLRQAVIAIRQAKLPDPAKIANNGSFFANPIVDTETFARLEALDNQIPNWPAGPGQVKLSAAWLVGKAGFKDFHDAETGMGTWHTQALVLINEHAQSTAQLLAFKQKIVDAVKDKFGIELQQEPELLP